MPRFRGHLYNWYETRTLEPIEPLIVSTVDSGNLAASLFTLHTGTRSLLNEKLLSHKVFHGLRDIVQLQLLQNSLPPAPAGEVSTDDWLRWTMHGDDGESGRLAVHYAGEKRAFAAGTGGNVDLGGAEAQR